MKRIWRKGLKKIAAGLLTAMFASALLTGCGNNAGDAAKEIQAAGTEKEDTTAEKKDTTAENKDTATENGDTTAEKKDYNGLTIRVGGCDFAIWNPQVNVAIHEGYFEEEFGKDGIKIETFNFANGPAGNEAFAAGELDIFNGTGDQPFVTAIGNNVPVVLLSTTGEQGKGSYIVVKADSGIETPADLKGKRIGLFIGTQAHKVWLQYLSANGLSEDDVQLVNLQSFTEQYAAFSNDEIDAFYATTFNYNSIKGDNVKDLGTLAEFPSRCYITAREGFVKEYPELVQRFFNVLVKAQDFIDKNPEKTYQYLSEDSGLTVDEVKTTVQEYGLYLRLDDEVAESVQATYRFLKEQGILEADIEDLASHFDASFVNNATAK